MTQTKQILWLRVFAEGAVIVVSVLLALAANAWWERRQDRLSEVEYLSALAAESADARADFESHLAFLNEQVGRATLVFDALSGVAVELADDSVDALVTSIVPPRPLVPPRAALDDLLGSGGLSLVRTGDVRRKIARYEQALAEDLAAQARLEDLWVSLRAPFRYEHAEMRLEPSGGILLDADRAAYVNNRTYRNLLTAHRLRMMDLARVHETVLALIDELSVLLQAS